MAIFGVSNFQAKEHPGEGVGNVSSISARDIAKCLGKAFRKAIA